MASVKISVDNLNQQKREYDKAIKNLDNALEQIKKVNHSLGKDAMLEEVRVLGNSGNRDAMRTIIFFKIKKIDVIRLG